MEKPKIITVYGFTKKTQKTEKRDISQGINFLEMYLSDKNTINPFDNL
jgi:phage-related protein